MSKTGIVSLVDTDPFAVMLPPKIEVLTFSRVTRWSFTFSRPEAFLRTRLSYNTVAMTASMVQSRNAGILTLLDVVVVFVVLVSSILFGVAHIGNSHITLIGFFNITLSGVLFALIYLKFKNLSAPIAMHFTWNFFQGSVLGYPVSGHDGWSLAKVNYISKSEILSGGLFGAEGSVVLIPISLFAILIFFVRTKRIAHIQS